jgi:threonyl-tRNA synthetase
VLDASTDHMKTKIANAEQMRVHTMLVIGNRDMEANAVSLRIHGKGDLGTKPRGEVALTSSPRLVRAALRPLQQHKLLKCLETRGHGLVKL